MPTPLTVSEPLIKAWKCVDVLDRFEMVKIDTHRSDYNDIMIVLLFRLPCFGNGQ